MVEPCTKFTRRNVELNRIVFCEESLAPTRGATTMDGLQSRSIVVAPLVGARTQCKTLGDAPWNQYLPFTTYLCYTGTQLQS